MLNRRLRTVLSVATVIGGFFFASVASAQHTPRSKGKARAGPPPRAQREQPSPGKDLAAEEKARGPRDPSREHRVLPPPSARRAPTEHGMMRPGSVRGAGHDPRLHARGGFYPSRPEIRKSVAVRRPYYRGTRLAHLPGGHRTVVLGGATYFVQDDVYYLPRYVGPHVEYVVVDPPIGARIVYMPEGYRTVIVEDRPYYIYNDVYYVEQVEGDSVFYAAVDVPIGATVVELPAERETVVVGGLSYYRVRESYYRPVYQEGALFYLRVNLPF